MSLGVLLLPMTLFHGADNCLNDSNKIAPVAPPCEYGIGKFPIKRLADLTTASSDTLPVGRYEDNDPRTKLNLVLERVKWTLDDMHF